MSSSRTFWCGASCVLESEELLALLMMVLLLEIMRSFPGNNVLHVLGREGVPLPFVTQGGKSHI